MRSSCTHSGTSMTSRRGRFGMRWSCSPSRRAMRRTCGAAGKSHAGPAHGRPRRMARRGPAVGPHGWWVVAVGSLVPKKGHHTLIEALALADDRWRLTIIGDGPTRQSLTRLAEFGVAGRVDLIGALSEDAVRAALRSAGVCALACAVTPDGDRDGIPVALIGGDGCGTAVVTTRSVRSKSSSAAVECSSPPMTRKRSPRPSTRCAIPHPNRPAARGRGSRLTPVQHPAVSASSRLARAQAS